MKAKAFFLMMGLIFLTTSLFSQESIIKKDNSVMKVKIIEIQENSIKYKPIEFLEGPVRSISLSEVSHVVYEDGKIETFSTLPVQSTSEEIPSASPQKTTSSKIDLLARVSIQVWDNDELAEFFGTNFSFGAGLEKQLFSHLKIGASFDFAGKSQYEVALNYFHVGGFVKFSWGDFGTSGFLIYTELGPRGIFIQEKEYKSSLTESGFGVSAVLGAHVRINYNLILDIRWDTTWGSIDIEGYKLKMNNNLFSAGIVFSL